MMMNCLDFRSKGQGHDQTKYDQRKAEVGIRISECLMSSV